LTSATGLFTILIVAGLKKIISATATIRCVTEAMFFGSPAIVIAMEMIVFETETTISMTEKIVSTPKKIFFVTDPIVSEYWGRIDNSADTPGVRGTLFFFITDLIFFKADMMVFGTKKAVLGTTPIFSEADPFIPAIEAIISIVTRLFP
jgi:hypothetical protein